MEQRNSTLKAIIETAQEKYLQEKIYRGRWKSIRASGIGDVCSRRIFYYMTCGEEAEEITTQLAAIFEEGKDQEPRVRRYLSELGFEVMKAGLSDYWPEYNISGQIDGILNNEYIAEIKTVSEEAWRSLETLQDFIDGSYHERWYAQMQVYLLLNSKEKGVFILKRKQAKQIRVIEVSLDYDYAEKLLKKAEAINAAIQSGNPPEYLKGNVTECRRCPFFGKVCNPPLDFGETQIIEDDKLAKDLSRREELSAAKSEYDKLDKEAKERLRDIPAAICGEFQITGKAGQMKQAAREASVITVWRTKIERINNNA